MKQSIYSGLSTAADALLIERLLQTLNFYATFLEAIYFHAMCGVITKN